MIRKAKGQQREKKVHPLIGLLLFVISILLLLITGPLGFLYGIFYTLYKSGIRGIGEYLLKIAVSIDQLGNVMMQHLLNAIWIKKDGYQFGNRDETISSALGRNKKLGKLTPFGRMIDGLLDFIDPNHSLNSIDYYIEPSEDIADELVWIHTSNRKILCLRNPGASYCLPGAPRIIADSDGEALYQSVKESLGVELDIATLGLEEIFWEPGSASKKTIRTTCYKAKFSGSLGTGNSFHEISWLGYADRDAVSASNRRIFDYLNQKGELV